MDDIYGDFWAAFLEQTGTPETTLLTNYTYFGADEAASVRALEELLSGERRAIGHCVPAYLTRKKRMPRAGDYTMVTDFYGNPCCILRTAEVVIAPMPEIPGDLRRAERPDLSPDAWMEEKRREYGALARRLGFHYHDEIPILLELVERVYPVRGDGEAG